jgi:hypothetical protein
MAKATIREVTTTKTVVVREGVTLELTDEEALVLSMLVGMINGSRHNTVRKHTDAIWETLNNAGYDHLARESLRGQLTGTLSARPASSVVDEKEAW